MVTFQDKQKTLFKRLKKLRDSATPYELILKAKLDQLNIKNIFQKGFIAGDNYCIADFYLPKPLKTVIEVDGEYHNNLKQSFRDKFKDRYYENRRFKVLRISNQTAKLISLNDLIDLIKSA